MKVKVGVGSPFPPGDFFGPDGGGRFWLNGSGKVGAKFRCSGGSRKRPWWFEVGAWFDSGPIGLGIGRDGPLIRPGDPGPSAGIEFKGGAGF